MTFARKVNKISEFYIIFARKIPKFYVIIARKNIFDTPDFTRGNYGLASFYPGVTIIRGKN